MTTLQQVEAIFSHSFSTQEAMKFARARAAAHEASVAASKAAARAKVISKRMKSE